MEFPSLIRRYYRHFSAIAFVRDLSVMQLGSLVYLGASMVSFILQARYLGSAAFGIYAVVLGFTGTVNTFLNLGQGASLLVFFAEAYGKKDRHQMTTVLRNFVHVAGTCTLILLVLAALADPLSALFYGPETTIGPHVRLAFLFAAVDTWNSLVLILLQSTRQIRTKVLLEQGANLAIMIATSAAAILGFGIQGVLSTQLLAGLFTLPISAWLLSRAVRRLQLPSLMDVLRAPVRPTFAYLWQGLLFSLDKNIAGLFPNALYFLLSLTAPATVVGQARIAVRLASVPRQLILPPVADLSTIVLARMQGENATAVRMNAGKVIKHAFALHAGASFLAMPAMPIVIWLLKDPQYFDALPLTLGLTLLSLPASLTIVNASLLRLHRKVHYSLIQTALLWLFLFATFQPLTTLTSPAVAFMAGYALAYGIPVLLTVYIFRTLIPPRTAT